MDHGMDRRWRDMPRIRRMVLIFVPSLVLGMAMWLFWAPPVVAAAISPPDAACKLCHGEMKQEMTLPSGETLQLGVTLDMLQQSVHGVHAASPVYCTDCHRDRARYQYPHQPNPAQNLGQFVAEIAQNCQQCHRSIDLHNPGHLQAKDKTGLPNCVDCHGGHDVAPVSVMNANPVATCQKCHQTYKDQQVKVVHEKLVASLASGQTCQTCHSDKPPATADALCKTCHSILTGRMALASGVTVPVHVDPQNLLDSVHGNRQINSQQYTALQCTDCHQDQAHYMFPHQPITATTIRTFTIQMAGVCQHCHENIYALNHNSVHAQALAEGKLNAATCIDCHGSHSIQDPAQPRERISHTCAQCHSSIYEQYAKSVHGAALLGQQNPDVPVCTNCHGVHNIVDPTTAHFRLYSPQICAKCHADKTMMAKYGISTDVFQTYVADFHGTTVELFEKQSPDQPTNKAVCYDCHGVHNILPPTDQNSQVMKQNLLTTCQKCHPAASANFPDAWMSHFRPSLQHNRLVYLVDLFYKILIPTVVGGFVLFIGADVYRRLWDRLRRRKKPKA